MYRHCPEATRGGAACACKRNTKREGSVSDIISREWKIDPEEHAKTITVFADDQNGWREEIALITVWSGMDERNMNRILRLIVSAPQLLQASENALQMILDILQHGTCETEQILASLMELEQATESARGVSSSANIRGES